jgi:hypothetical protein
VVRAGQLASGSAGARLNAGQLASGSAGARLNAGQAGEPRRRPSMQHGRVAMRRSVAVLDRATTTFAAGLVVVVLASAAGARERGAPFRIAARFPMSGDAAMVVGTVYLYDEKKGTVRAAAAMGDAAGFAPLRRSEILSLLPKGEVFRDYEFLWSDRDGNGRVDAGEVDFQRKKWTAAVGPFDEALGCCGNGVYYRVTGILPNGVPAYERTPAPGRPILRLKGDWGILTSNDGHLVKVRSYWSNAGATGTSDEAVEARLEPQHWGVLAFE